MRRKGPDNQDYVASKARSGVGRPIAIASCRHSTASRTSGNGAHKGRPTPSVDGRPRPRGVERNPSSAFCGNEKAAQFATPEQRRRGADAYWRLIGEEWRPRLRASVPACDSEKAPCSHSWVSGGEIGGFTIIRDLQTGEELGRSAHLSRAIYFCELCEAIRFCNSEKGL